MRVCHSKYITPKMPGGKVYITKTIKVKICQNNLCYTSNIGHPCAWTWMDRQKKNMNGSVQVVQKPSANASRTECAKHYIYISLSSSLKRGILI